MNGADLPIQSDKFAILTGDGLGIGRFYAKGISPAGRYGRHGFSISRPLLHDGGTGAETAEALGREPMINPKQLSWRRHDPTEHFGAVDRIVNIDALERAVANALV